MHGIGPGTQSLGRVGIMDNALFELFPPQRKELNVIDLNLSVVYI